MCHYVDVDEAYARYWEGCTFALQMKAEWFDSCSLLVAFCRHSKIDPDIVLDFQNLIVRLNGCPMRGLGPMWRGQRTQKQLRI